MKKSFKTLCRAALGLALTLSASIAQAQVAPTTIVGLTNLPAYVEAGGTSNLLASGATPSTANNVISVRQGIGLATAGLFAGTNAAASTGFVINWALSFDGTNFCTNSASLLAFTNTPNGSNSFCNGTNFGHSLIDNALYAAPFSIVNSDAAHGGIFINNVVVSLGNIVPGAYQ